MTAQGDHPDRDDPQQNRSTREPDPLPKPTGAERFGTTGSGQMIVNGKPLSEVVEEAKRKRKQDGDQQHEGGE